MAKRRHDGEETQATKKIKFEPSHKRHNDGDNDTRASKRHKTYEYWHMAPLTREEKAVHMAAIYEHLCCRV
tara:strand:+ start:569 stop:781 length:213 start_codon:yes stop_codon:yes gene_type:complete